MPFRMPESPDRSVPPASDESQALYVGGLLALRNGDAATAISLLDRALRLRPSHPGMRRNLIRALLLTERFEDVLTQAGSALADRPDDAELHFARGTALNGLGRPEPARAALVRALSLQPEHAAAWLNMGNAAADLDDLQTAEAACRRAVALDPALVEAHASLGHTLTRQGQLAEAIEACEAAIRLRPGFPQAHWNLAIATLLSGDLPRGFQEYEWRKRHRRYRADFPPLPGPEWDGTPGAKTILVRAEQGQGDTIQFARYLSLIREAGANPVLLCSLPLVALVRSMPGVAAVSSSQPLPAYDAWIDQISLPLAFGTGLDTIPTPTAYLTAEPARIAAWRARLDDLYDDPPKGGSSRRIGIALAGNPNHRFDRLRSIPRDLVPWADLPEVSFVSLQHGPSTALPGLPDLTRWLTDYAETAALIETLDLVITVDTSIAHLAGALGKPVWILLPHAPDWRWLLGRRDSPWYRSARLFRQPTAGDWASVLTQVMQQLNSAA